VTGRNDPCPCGSGKRYKNCCGDLGAGASPSPLRQEVNAGFQEGAANASVAMEDGLGRLVALYHARRYADAEEGARLLLERHQDSGALWKILGASLQAQGKDSLPALQRAAELLPGEFDVHCNVGNALAMLGRLDDAECSYRQALRIEPDYADAHYSLGNILGGMARLSEAEASYRQALRLRPDFAEAYGNLGNVMSEQGRLHEAETSYRQALQLNPGYVVAHFNLGNICHKLGRLSEAEASYRRALQYKPDFVEAYCNLGRTLHDLDCLPEAEASYRQALLIRPDSPEIHSNLGNVLLDLHRMDEAEACYLRALSISPDYAEAHCKYGIYLLEAGRLDEAVASLRRALEISPDCIEAQFSLALAGKVKPEGKDLAALVAAEEAFRSGARPLSEKDAMFLHFALGKSYDDIGDYDKAFPHFIEGCRLKRVTFGYDPDEMERYFVSIMRNFDAESMERLRGGGDPSQIPIFVLGMPRSGTTLTEQIIASHPGVHGAGELPDLMGIARRDIGGRVFPDNMSRLDRGRMAAWGEEYVAGLRRRAPEARRITDKTPRNFLAVGLIHLMLPDAKIIHVNRNPVDTCLSCFTTLFNHGQEHTYDLAELGRYYAGYARLMRYWRKVLPEGAFLEVQYEDIVADQEGQARRLIEYCGLEWDDACLDFHENRRAVHTASMTQVRQPIYRSSVERWRRYEKFLGPLFGALGDLAPGGP